MGLPISLKDIRTALDPIADWQPNSVMEIARRLRWELHAPNNLEEPEKPISLRDIGDRVKGPQTDQVHLLSYNTYLLAGFDLPLGRWLDNLIGWDALSWFGIPFGGALLAELGLASIPGLALETILKEAGWTPSKIIQKITGKDLNDLARIAAKPTLDQRASAIGQHVIGTNVYDVCCLSEVWMEDARNRIVNSLDQNWQHQTGPNDSGDWTILGAGLLFLHRKGVLVDHKELVYSNRGIRQRDPDAWTNKGVMLNVLQFPAGKLEVFQTHLYYGGGIPISPDPTSEERRAVWESELTDLVNFVRANHDPRNVAIITGDFNMDGAKTNEEFADIVRHMDEINMRDVWKYGVYRHGTGLTCRYTDGDESGHEQNFDNECPPPLPMQDSAWPTLTTYCPNDSEQVGSYKQGVGRLDYMWIENPTREHTYRLEVSRMLRRPFPFHTSGGNTQQGYLSDHMGLDCMLFLSRR